MAIFEGTTDDDDGNYWNSKYLSGIYNDGGNYDDGMEKGRST